MKISNKTYDLIKAIALFFIPAFATFIGSIGQIWDIPYTDKIVLTTTAIGTLISAIVGKLKYDYKKNKIIFEVDVNNEEESDG